LYQREIVSSAHRKARHAAAGQNGAIPRLVQEMGFVKGEEKNEYHIN